MMKKFLSLIILFSFLVKSGYSQPGVKISQLPTLPILSDIDSCVFAIVYNGVTYKMPGYYLKGYGTDDSSAYHSLVQLDSFHVLICNLRSQCDTLVGIMGGSEGSAPNLAAVTAVGNSTTDNIIVKLDDNTQVVTTPTSIEFNKNDAFDIPGINVKIDATGINSNNTYHLPDKNGVADVFAMVSDLPVGTTFLSAATNAVNLTGIVSQDWTKLYKINSQFIIHVFFTCNASAAGLCSFEFPVATLGGTILDANLGKSLGGSGTSYSTTDAVPIFVKPGTAPTNAKICFYAPASGARSVDVTIIYSIGI